MSDSIIALFSMGFMFGVIAGGILVGVILARDSKGSSESHDKDDRINVRYLDNCGFVLCSGDNDVRYSPLGDVHGQELNRYPMGYNPYQE